MCTREPCAVASNRRAASVTLRRSLVLLVFIVGVHEPTLVFGNDEPERARVLSHPAPPFSLNRQDEVEPQRESSAQPISVEDLVRFANFGDPNALRFNSFPKDVAIPSPDGRYIAVLLRKGNIEKETNDAELFVYAVSKLFGDARPRKVAELSSATNEQPIAMVRWLPDSKSLVFAGTHGEEPSQVYRVDLRTQRVEKLTNGSTSLITYGIARAGDRIVMLREWPWQPMTDRKECRRRGCRVVVDTLPEALFGLSGRSERISVRDVSTGATRTLASPDVLDETVKYCDGHFYGGISPDGRFALQRCQLRTWPSWWEGYTAEAMSSQLWRDKHPAYAGRWILVDLETGVARRVSDAPAVVPGLTPEPAWIDQGRQLLIFDAFEPLIGVSSAERARRASSYAVVAIDPVTLETTRVASLPRNVSRILPGSGWHESSETITLQVQDVRGNRLPDIRYRRKGRQWVAGAPPVPVQKPSVDVVVEQSPNDPPLLVAIDRASGKKRVLMDPNPWLSKRKLGRVEEVSWQAADGRRWHGGIYYPPGFVRGKRYPLMMQVYGFRSWQFSLNGYVEPFVGRALAAHDVIVLDVAVAGQLSDVGNTPAVWEAARAGLEGAIDHLSSMGIVDRERVGIQGFSYSGPQVGYALTHSCYRFAAAALTSTSDDGWWYYLLKGARRSIEAKYGAPPFGEGMKSWVQYAPSFNLDRVSAPVMLWSEVNASGQWEWYAGLKRLEKPVEFWLLADGQHNVFKVGERLLTYQLLVDWFRFWLTGEEDADPAKAEQYVRWREYRAKWKGFEGREGALTRSESSHSCLARSDA